MLEQRESNKKEETNIPNEKARTLLRYVIVWQ